MDRQKHRHRRKTATKLPPAAKRKRAQSGTATRSPVAKKRGTSSAAQREKSTPKKITRSRPDAPFKTPAKRRTVRVTDLHFSPLAAAKKVASLGFESPLGTGVCLKLRKSKLETDPLLWSVTTERPPWLSRIHETHELRARVVDFLRETVGRASIIRFLQYVGFTVQHPDDVIGSDGQIVRQTGSSCGKVAAYNVKLLTEATDWFTESPETFAVSVGDPALKEVASHMKYQRGLYENTDSDQVQHAITQMCGVRDCVRAADTFIQEVVEDLSGLATASDALSSTRLERFRVSNTDTMSGQGLHWIAIAWSAIPKSTTERHPS